MIPVRVKWETILGVQYEGTLFEVDNGTGIIRMDDETIKGVDIECLELSIPQ